jgi:hypothetical protein
MTAQMPEKLFFEGKSVPLLTNPLSQYFEMSGTFPNFYAPNTALWRGYIGYWEILADRLYLTRVEGRLVDDTNVCLNELFPGFADRVFAHWFSGPLRIPKGKMLEYFHGGYGSVFEEDIIISVLKGILTDTKVIRNGTLEDPDAVEGYRLGGFTTLAKQTDRGD